MDIVSLITGYYSNMPPLIDLNYLKAAFLHAIPVCYITYNPRSWKFVALVGMRQCQQEKT